MVGAAALGAARCATSPASTSSSGPTAEGAPLEAVIDAVQGALSEALAAESPDFPALKTATVKLETAAVRSLSGEIAVIVFSAGSAVAREDSSTLELRLRPPPPPPKRLAPAAVKDALAKAIHLARLAAARAARGTPPLAVDRLEIEVKFSIDVQGSAGGRVALVPVGVEAKGKVRRASIQTINLVFGN